MIRQFTPGPRVTRVALFSAAILLPSAVLVFLTWRLLALDRELAGKREADELARLIEKARTTFLLKTDQIRRRADADPPAAVVATGVLDGDRIVFEWERSRAAAQAAAELATPAFADVFAVGEQLEYGNQPVEARAIYMKALARSATPVQRAASQLAIGRAAAKAGDVESANAAYLRLLETPPDAVDDEGIPYAVYAARAVPTGTGALGATLARIVAAARAPSVLFMVDDICQTACSTELRTRIAQSRDAAAQVLEHRDVIRLVAPSSSDDTIWVSVGDAPELLASVVQEGGATHVTVLRADEILADLPEGLTLDDSPATLAPNFPGISVRLAAARAAQIENESRARRPLFLAALATVVGLAIAGAYLFLRDVRRDLAVAQLRSQFVSSVSHELKTPLTGIRVSAETLLFQRREDGTGRDYLETIVSETDRLTRLLDNVLEFAAIDSGRKVYRFAECEIGAVVRAAVRGIEYALQQQGFSLAVDIDSTMPAMHVDADAVQQAVLNLLSNAMKYSGESRDITLTVHRDGEEAVIAVADRGIGIAPEEQHRIFEQFYRVRNDETSRIPGTGLGLTLVEHVARLHGGRVSLTSTPGAGSTFALHLPCQASAAS